MTDPLGLVWWALGPGPAIVVVVGVALIVVVVVGAFSGGRP